MADLFWCDTHGEYAPDKWNDDEPGGTTFGRVAVLPLLDKGDQ